VDLRTQFQEQVLVGEQEIAEKEQKQKQEAGYFPIEATTEPL
jgi:hypothetical protein